MTIAGTWPEYDIRRAFVMGSKWWEHHKTRATMWKSDRRLAEDEAAKRYPVRNHSERFVVQGFHPLKKEWEDLWLPVPKDPKDLNEAVEIKKDYEAAKKELGPAEMAYTDFRIVQRVTMDIEIKGETMPYPGKREKRC